MLSRRFSGWKPMLNTQHSHFAGSFYPLTPAFQRHYVLYIRYLITLLTDQYIFKVLIKDYHDESLLNKEAF